MKLTKSKNQWIRIFKIFIPYILFVGIFQAVATSLVGMDFRHYDQQNISTFQFFILTISGLFGTVLIIWIFLKYVDKENIEDLGFKYFLIEDIKIGLLIGFFIMLLGFTILLLCGQIKILLIQFNLIDVFLNILIFMCVALSEEILIRGYVLGNLMKSINKYYALLWSSIIFSLMHAANPNISWFSFFELFLSGILLGVSYIYTKNLWFPISLHFSWNFFQGTIFGFNVSGLNGYSIINIENLQTNIWNGGAFGFEGSIISILFQLIAVIIIYIIFYKSENDIEDVIPEVSLAS